MKPRTLYFSFFAVVMVTYSVYVRTIVHKTFSQKTASERPEPLEAV